MKPNKSSPRKAKPCIHAKDLVLGYALGKQINPIASGISFELFHGELTCLMGPNGVGKSTLLKAIMSQNLPINGEIWFGETSASQMSDLVRAQNIAVVLTEKIRSGLMTVRELVALGRSPHTGLWGHLSAADNAFVNQVLELTHLGDIAEKRLSQLSDGQRQTAMIARALAQDSNIMVLDEPTAHLDLTNRFDIMYLLKKLAKEAGKAILVVTHDLEVAMETADQLWIMATKEPLVAGSPEDLMLEGHLQKLLPGEKWEIDSGNGKIRLKTPSTLPEISGPEHLTYWVKNALRKNIEIPMPDKIVVSQNPFEIIIFSEQNYFTFSRISEMIRFLKN
ncbi:ABC transporter ATP-binding protein [uncultured Cyclobacterium sp.]|uniref:ABC transporter ATP-binding protein n=1 Tax=uncultured Cyclobacterium sp. TaxID=453820 RepID=UPI0030ECE296|tara:strand:- start:50837 stop:51844 length:1008 start_codon:yes stop_codon:yes gene_type:complete